MIDLTYYYNRQIRNWSFDMKSIMKKQLIARKIMAHFRIGKPRQVNHTETANQDAVLMWQPGYYYDTMSFSRESAIRTPLVAVIQR